MKQIKIAKEDWSKVGVNPDPDFNFERNQKIIDDVLRKARLKKQESLKQWRRDVAERVHATAKYIDALQSDKTKSAEQYFGKKYLAYLRGKEFIEQLKDAKEKEKRQTQGL